MPQPRRGPRLYGVAMPQDSATRELTSLGPGIDTSHPVMRLWHLSKRDGTWDPMAIGLEQDARDWTTLTEDERRLLVRVGSVFLGGEESVTREILPLIQLVEREDRLEEEIYLTSFLWEEAKHVEFFWRFFEEVAADAGGPADDYSAAYRTIFVEELPERMDALTRDPSPADQARASVTYHQIVEGVLAKTGYHAYETVLEEHDVLPGFREGLVKVQRDETRHMAYGTFLLSRLVAEHGDPVWTAIEDQMDRMLEPALELVQASFDRFDPMPFGLEREPFLRYAQTQQAQRFEKLEQAREMSVEDVHRRFGERSAGALEA